MRIILKNCIKYYNTIRYLRPIQIIGQIRIRLKRSKIIKVDFSKDFELTQAANPWTSPARRTKRMIEKNIFNINNVTRKVLNKDDWNDLSLNKLWLYNLHYFDDLNAIDSEQRREWHYEYISKWVEHNPPGEGNGWESYTVSLRIVNWIKWHLNGSYLKDQAIQSLLLQARFLSNNLETHLLGNHLFANGKALIFAGIFFSHEESKLWYQKGLSILSNELSEQILKDGGSFELSTMYHVILLEDLLDILNIHLTYNKNIPDNLIEKICLMFDWLKVMCHPDGEISFFNDAAFKVSPSCSEIESYIKRLKNIFDLDINLKKKNKEKLINLNASGYSRIQSKNVVLLIDRAAIGPDFLPGHAHADTLSFELSLFNKRVIVNSGTSTYEVGEERDHQRGTTAHSTIAIDSQNSSETWGSFRVAKRAKTFNFKSDVQKGKMIVSASHNGYHRLKGKPTHTRKWHVEDNLLEITDDISGRGDHNMIAVFPLHPEVRLLSFEKEKVNLDLFGKQIEILFFGQGELVLKDSFYYPEFGLALQNIHLHYKLSGRLPIQLITKVIW